MVMLSQLLRCHLIDAKGQRARIADFSVDLNDGDYPPVLAIVCAPEKNRQHGIIAWESVEVCNHYLTACES